MMHILEDFSLDCINVNVITSLLILDKEFYTPFHDYTHAS